MSSQGIEMCTRDTKYIQQATETRPHGKYVQKGGKATWISTWAWIHWTRLLLLEPLHTNGAAPIALWRFLKEFDVSYEKQNNGNTAPSSAAPSSTYGSRGRNHRRRGVCRRSLRFRTKCTSYTRCTARGTPSHWSSCCPWTAGTLRGLDNEVKW